ncbi:hypothetical protein [Streptomyces sp. NPDC048277]|uniref:hypothetical protein n=1 Tax=Streptomyces sp. NPDC048277 TaxID=3155027 RepID=UPI0033DA9B4B
MSAAASGATRPGEPRGAVRLGTFDAERRWRPEGLAALPTVRDIQGDRAVAAMDELLAAACGPEDLLVTGADVPRSYRTVLAAAGLPLRHRPAPAVPDGAEGIGTEQRLLAAPPAGLDGYRLAPYAVLPETAALVRNCGLRGRLPEIGAVRAVSSKTWSNMVVRAFGLPGAGTTVTSTAALRAEVVRIGDRPGDGTGAVLVKDPYGVAGRGTLAITSPRVLDSVARALERQVESGAAVELLVQPRYDAVADFSAHFDVLRGGGIGWHGVRLMRNATFSYAGSAPPGRALARRLDAGGYQETMRHVGAALAASGYHGPACVDSMLLRDGTVVPVLEINPRMSMGLIGLLLERRLSGGEGTGPAVRLGVRSVRPAVPDPHQAFTRLATALDDEDVLYRAGGTGVLPLSAGTLLYPRGRLYYAVVAESPEQDRLLRAALDRAVREAVETAAVEVAHVS